MNFTAQSAVGGDAAHAHSHPDRTNVDRQGRDKDKDKDEDKNGAVDSWRLLLAACSCFDLGSARSPLQILLQPFDDWNQLLALANRHGVSSLLHHALEDHGDLVPDTVWQALQQSFQSNVHRTLFLARELIRIVDCVESLGTEALPYKGVILSETYYGDMAMRPSGDMDIFIDAKDLPRIKAAVREMGYTARVPVPANAQDAYIATGYECTFDAAAGKNLLELQWALQPRFYAVDYDMRGLFDRAEDVSVAGRSMRTPSPEDLLLVLSVHAAKHAWGRLIWLCDIAQIVKRQNLNWDWIQAQARELGIERILHITLLLTHRFLATKIPSSIEAAAGRERATLELCEQIARSVEAGVEYEEKKMSYFRLMLKLRERRWDRWRFAARLAFTPGPGEWEVVQLPKSLFFLYIIVRLGRLAGRFVG